MTSQDNILYIKNMVCDRCCMVVSEVFSALGLEPVHVELGKVELAEPPAIAVQTAGPVARVKGNDRTWRVTGHGSSVTGHALFQIVITLFHLNVTQQP